MNDVSTRVAEKDYFPDYAIVYRVNVDNGEFEILHMNMRNPMFTYGYKDFYEMENDFYNRGVDKEYISVLPGEEIDEELPVEYVRLDIVKEYFKNNSKAITAYYKEKNGRWLKLVVRKEINFGPDNPYVVYYITECYDEMIEKTKNIIYSSAVSKMYCMVITLAPDRQQYKCIHCVDGLGIEKGYGSYDEFMGIMEKQIFEEDFHIFQGLIDSTTKDINGFVEREYRIEDERGMFHFISAYSTYITLPEGERILILCRNVDEQAASRARIKTLNEKYEQVQNTLYALGKPYFGIYYLNLQTGRMVATRQGEDIRRIFEDSVEYEDLFDSYIDKFVYALDKDKVKIFSDLDNIRNSLHSKGERIYLEYQRTFGTVFKWVRLEYQAIKCVDGKAVTAIMAFRDIHEEKMAEMKVQKELSEALEASKQASNAKSRFLSNMSHDIRTPMNAIMGMTNIALNHIDDVDKVKSCLEKINVSTEHLLKLVNEVLDISYIESGKIVLKHEGFILSDLCKTIFMIMQERFESKNQNFTIDSSEVVDEELFGDRIKIQQVMINILSNATKYTNEGGDILMKIKQTETFADSAVYVFSIKDTGKGMSEEFVSRIFNLFERESVAEDNVEGTGLGMPITKGIVEAMDGTIKIESSVNKGSEFIVTLPLKFDRSHSEPVVVNASGGPVDILVGKKILVVDDNDINCNIACDYLEDRGVITDVAINGKEAFNMISSGEYFDMILMDVRMPVMDGYEATRRIRGIGTEYCLNVPIIAMTANAFESDVQKGKEAGMNDHISKPINIEVFYNVIQKNLL